jgi:hypothetical protein
MIIQSYGSERRVLETARLAAVRTNQAFCLDHALKLLVRTGLRPFRFFEMIPLSSSSSKPVRPEQFERRARLVSAVARGRRWLDDVVSGRVTTILELCAREKCRTRQVNMTISLAFLAPNLVRAAVEGRLPRGVGIERLRDPPTEWS